MKKYSLVCYRDLYDYGCECCEERRSRDHEVAALRHHAVAASSLILHAGICGGATG
jgi:hypothetical protein